MPIKHKFSDDKKSPILKWLLWAPLKFTGVFTLLTIPLLLLMNFLFSIQLFNISYIITVIGLLFISAFSVYKIIHWTPKTHLDHKSFIMLNTGQNLISLILLAVIGFISVYISRVTTFNIAVTLAVIISLLTIFLIANGILKLKGLCRRGRAQNIPTWKLWLSMPLGISLFWYSGFLLPDNKKTAPVLTTKFKAFDTLISWIAKKPVNTIIAFLIFVTMGGIMMVTQINAIIIFYIISLLLMLFLLKWKKLRNNLGKGFANVAILLNIIAIIGILFVLINTPKQTLITGEQIQITEVK